ncbi:hypothetical protein SOPP22_10830 [Shewanella sp. OPT22]|nr:hypothetical protein SOPP22_10830 [Shewanella sp. OPT22]
MSAPASANKLQNNPHSELLSAVNGNAELAVNQFQEQASSNLDYSRNSLSGLEFVIDDASDIFDVLEPEQAENLVNLFASYILSVAYKEFGGRFSLINNDDEVIPVLILGEPDFEVVVLAHDKVRGRINGDKADNIPFFYQGIVEHVKSAIKGKKVVIK